MRALRIAHRWLGLALALPMLLQGLSGTVLAVVPFWEAWRPMPAVGDAPSQSAGAVLAAAAMPGLVPVSFRPAETGRAATVGLGQPGQRGAVLEVMVDPGSLAVLGTRRSSITYRWVHGLHEQLLLPEWGGRSVIGWFGVGLLLLGLSGLVLWWPSPGRWKSAVTVTRRARGARLQRDLHGAAGFWFSLMLVMMSASGVTMAFPRTVGSLLGVPAGFPPRGGGGEREALDLDTVLRVAAEAVPGATVGEVRLPSEPGRPVMIRLQAPGTLSGSPSVMLTVDPAGRRVVSLRDPRRQGGAALTLAWLRALHNGDVFGAPWRALVALTGVTLSTLAATGTALWLLRRRNRQRLNQQRLLAVSNVT